MTDSPFTTRIERTVDAFAWWDELAATAGLYLSARWLRHSEPMLEQWYVGVERDGVIVAAAACAVAREPATLNRLTEPRWLFSASETNDTPDLNDDALYPFLACGAPSLHKYQLLLRPGMDPTARAEAVVALVRAVRELGQQVGAKVVGYLFLLIDDVRTLLAAEPALLPCFVGGCAVLSPLESFDGYLAGFRSKDRWTLQRDIKRAEAAGLSFEFRPIADVLDASMPLLADNHARHHTPFDVERARKVIEGWMSLGDDALASCAWRGDQLVGVTLFLRHADIFYGILVGRTGDLDKHASVYFNTVFYEPIRQAQRRGIRTIHYGTSALSTKVRRGCHIEPRWTLLQPIAPFPAEYRTLLDAGNRFRLAEDLRELTGAWGDERAKSALDWDQTQTLMSMLCG